MKAVVQRVISASVLVNNERIAKIGQGMLILLGIKTTDTKKDAEFMAEKCCGLRIFEDEHGKMNLPLSSVNGKILIVSNFTIYGDCHHGKRPSFTEAALPEYANELYEYFTMLCRSRGILVETGTFRADMKVELCNDGPITLIVSSDHLS